MFVVLRRLAYYLRSIPVLLGRVENWPVLGSLALGRAPAEVRLRGGLRFRVRSLMDAWIVKETCLDDEYELEEFVLHARAAPRPQVVVDIGAGLGDFSIRVGRSLPDARVLAVEPSPSSIALFAENLALNRVANVEYAACAIGARRGELVLRTDGEPVMHTAVEGERGTETVRVACVSLEEFFVLHGVTRCDLLKIDCEGAEYDILLHASPETLGRVERIALEYHEGVTPHDHTDLVAHLSRCGFRVRRERNQAHDYLGLLFAERSASPAQVDA